MEELKVEEMTSAELLDKVLGDDVRPELVEEMEREGIKRAEDLLACDKSDLRTMGFNIMEANRILKWASANGFVPATEMVSAAALQPPAVLDVPPHVEPETVVMSDALPHPEPVRPVPVAREEKPRPDHPPSLVEDVERFTEQLSPGDRSSARDQILALPQQEVEQILATNISTVRNPASLVFKKINEATQYQAVVEYARKWNLGRSACEALLSIKSQACFRVMQRGLETARKPSAVVLSRVRTLVQAEPTAVCKDPRRINPDDFPDIARDPSPPRIASMPKKRSRSRSHSAERSRSRSRSATPTRWRRRSHSRSSTPSRPHIPYRSRSRSPRARSGGTYEDEVDEFVMRWAAENAKDKMRQELLELPRSRTREILRRDYTSAKNPTGLILKNLRDLRMTCTLDDFVRDHHLSASVQSRLRSLPAALQQQVISKELNSARNPSAVVLARINDVEKRGGAGVLPPVAKAPRLVTPSTPMPALISSTVSEKDHKILNFAQMYRLDDECVRHLQLLDSASVSEIIRNASRLRGSPTSEWVKAEVREISKDRRTYRITRRPGEIIGIDFEPGTLFVGGIIPKSPAAEAGMERGWEVVAVNGIAIHTKQDAIREAGSAPVFFITVRRRRRG